MVIMAKVYMFPEKKKLPANFGEQIWKLGKEYMQTVYAVAKVLGVDDPDQPEYMEVMELIAEAFGEGISAAMIEIVDEEL
jgi:hypothetical protein